MVQSWQYFAFSEAEHRSRLDRARELMQSAGLDVCACASPELIYYFTGYDAHTHLAIGSQMLVLSADNDTPTLILRDGDVPQAEETLVIGELHAFRIGSISIAKLARDVIHGYGLSKGKLGLDISGITMNGALTAEINGLLDRFEIIDCWRLLGQLRTVLSLAEIEYLREATSYANLGIDAFYQKAKIGMSEIELAGEIEYAMRSAGSDYFTIPTWMASGPRSHCQHGMATPRRLESGDLVHAEFCGVARRYQSMSMGSLVLGEPNVRMLAMAKAGREGFEAGEAAAKVGCRIGDLEQVYFEVLDRHDMIDTGVMRFGVGISAAYPPVWENQITIQLECDDLLQPGMAFYLHSSMQSMSDKVGMLLGGSFLMTEQGPERLDKAVIDLVVVDG